MNMNFAPILKALGIDGATVMAQFQDAMTRLDQCLKLFDTRLVDIHHRLKSLEGKIDSILVHDIDALQADIVNVSEELQEFRMKIDRDAVSSPPHAKDLQLATDDALHIARGERGKIMPDGTISWDGVATTPLKGIDDAEGEA